MGTCFPWWLECKWPPRPGRLGDTPEALGWGEPPQFRPREQEHTWVLLKPLDPLNPVLMDPGQVTQ